MNPEANISAPQTGVRRGRRVWIAAVVAILVCAGAVMAIAFRSEPAQPVAVVPVQGELISPQAQSNAPAITIVAAPQPPPVTVMAPVAGTPAPAAAKTGDYVQIGFDKLAGFPLRLRWVMVDPVRIKGVQKMIGDVPPEIKSLDQSKIAVRGFMLPLKLEDGKVTEFFLLRTQARCCYGLPIQMNELLTVHMDGPGVKSIMDQPITIYGRLHIGESHDAAGVLTSIYSLDGDKMALPAAL
jgi:hypothetical protein